MTVPRLASLSLDEPTRAVIREFVLEFARDIERMAVENERLRVALKGLIQHADNMESQHQDYHTLGFEGVPCRSQPLLRAMEELSSRAALGQQKEPTP